MTAILEKVRKLLALAEGGADEHECAAAAEAAARILARHGLTLDALEAGRDDEEPEDHREECRGWEDPLPRPGTWAGVLIHGLATAHGCYSYHGGGKAYLIGRASNVAGVRYLATWLLREVEHLAQRQRGNGRAWINAYRHGCVGAILEAVAKARRETLGEARRDALSNGRSLIPIDDASRRLEARRKEAETWGRVNLHLRAGSGYRFSSSDGYGAGRRDGAGVYGNGHARLGPGSVRIGPGR